LSAGANDFKVRKQILFGGSQIDRLFQQARLASTTAWIASPAETVELLDELEAAIYK
jgi:hypothetical protein